MVAETSVSNSADPLNDLGALPFPRSLRAATSDDVSLPADFNHLESIHNFLKNANVTGSPERLRNEAMRVVDGGPELLESEFVRFAKSVGMTDDIGVKVKDKPRERRQGLGLERKRTFTLKTSSSQRPVNLEPDLSDDKLEDPDAFFDAYASYDKTEKDIQILMGGSRDTLNQDNLSTRVRVRRPGILGKSYNIKHRYTVPSPEKVDRLISSVEEVEEGTKSAGEDDNDAQDKMSNPEPDLDVDMAEAELPVSLEKSDKQSKDIFDELLSGNDEELDEEGALNILQEHLKIKPLDWENLGIPVSHDYGRSSISSIWSAGKLKSPRSSMVINNVLKNVNKSPIVRESAAQNPDIPSSSPSPPRNVFASVSSLLKKRTQESNSPKDPFSPLDTEFSEWQNTSSAVPIDKLQEQVDIEAKLSMSGEINSESEVAITEHTRNMGERKATGSEDSLPDKFVDETAIILTGNAKTRQNEVPDINNEETMNPQETVSECQNTFSAVPIDKLQEQVDIEANLSMSSELNSDSEVAVIEHAHNMGEWKATGCEGSLPDRFVDENAVILAGDAETRQNEVPDINNEETRNTQETMNINNRDSSSLIQDEAVDNLATRVTKQPKVNQVDLQKARKEVNKKRIRNLHPMRKSIAEAGTSFENGVRTSKRIKLRPLEFWRGEKPLYAPRLNTSDVKLIGVRCFSPENRQGDLKVKPLIPPREFSKYKETLDLAARH